MEEWLAEGKYILGTQAYTLADVVATTFLAHLEFNPEFYNLEVMTLPKVSAYKQQM